LRTALEVAATRAWNGHWHLGFAAHTGQSHGAKGDIITVKIAGANYASEFLDPNEAAVSE